MHFIYADSFHERDESQLFTLTSMLSTRGGGGGSLPLEVVPDARESPSQSTLNEI